MRLKRSKKWVNVGDGVQIHGGYHSRKKFVQRPQGKSGPAIRKPYAGDGEVDPRHTPPSEDGGAHAV